MRPIALVCLAGILTACGSPAPPPSAAKSANSPLLRTLARIEDQRLAGAPELAAALSDADAAVRARAALAAGRIQDAVHVPALATLARADGEVAVRFAAVFALGQMGLREGASPPPEAVAAVAALFAEPDLELARRTVEAYGKLAPADAAEALTAALKHTSPRVRAEAAVALFRLRFVPLWRGESEGPAALPAPAVAALGAAMEDPDLEVRRAAVYACSRFGEPGAVAALRARLGESDVETRLFAVRALGRSSNPAAVEELVARCGDASAAVRAEAVAALANLSAVSRVPAGLVRDPSFHVRAALARALGNGERDTAVALLLGLWTDSSPSVRSAALESLALLDAPTAQRLVEGEAELAPWPVRVSAIGAAGRFGPAGFVRLEAALRSPDLRLQAAALEALGGISGDAADALVRGALASPDLAVRGTAVQAVVDRKLPDALALLSGVVGASPGEDWIEIREGIVDAAAPLDGSEALLRRLAADDAAPSVRGKAALALRKKGIEVAAPAPLTIAPSPFLETHFERDPVVTLETSKGRIEIRCFAEDAPVHVANFVSLVEKGFYNGLLWHRVVSNFVVQGGDPRGDGWGGPGYTVRDEINTHRFERGTVGMPKAGKDTGGGQLFITHISTPHLDGNYTVFGQVTAGLEVVDALEVGDTIERASVKR